MKIRVEFTVEIDSEAWELDYGIPVAEQRADVRSYCKDAVHAQLEQVGMGRVIA